MRHEPEKFLFDMLDAVDFLLGFIVGKSQTDLETDRAFRSAVERELQNIGEALFQMNRRAPEVAHRISDCVSIIGMRHVLVHGYDQVKPAVLWNVLTTRLIPLRDELRQLLGRPPQ